MYFLKDLVRRKLFILNIQHKFIPAYAFFVVTYKLYVELFIHAGRTLLILINTRQKIVGSTHTSCYYVRCVNNVYAVITFTLITKPLCQDTTFDITRLNYSFAVRQPLPCVQSEKLLVAHKRRRQSGNNELKV